MPPKPIRMDNATRVRITVRKTAANKLSVEFPEDISKDVSMIGGPRGEVPIEYLNAALARSLAARTQLAAGCNDKCSKDCLW